MPYSNVSAWSESARDYMTALRRYFHQNPEIAWQEEGTGNRICAELNAMEIPYERVVGTGVVAVLQGPPGAPVVGLRADMDALPILEENKADYASQNTGVMHACGHDGHIAILLGVAKILAAHREELTATVKLIFQPAEERFEGAKEMVRQPCLADLSYVGALHLWAHLPVGSISVMSGPRLAGADTFELVITGRNAHGSMPHLGVDALYVACLIENALQAVVSRMSDPLEPVVVTVGTMRAGTAPNIVSDRVELTGTIRSFTPALRESLPRTIEHLAHHLTAAFGAGYEFRLIPGTPPTVNDPACAALARACAADVVGPLHVIECPRTTGGEDFAYFMERAPGMMAFVGCSNAEKHAPHHHGSFDIDEDCLEHGAAFLTAYALRVPSLSQ